ncbi:MAG TPA: efflux RND transporter periplasmic adaptor subunit [Bacteroides sp.]|nr:efflux RND transporter periplasmic adaptor subunit [Bacteroides sp.]
MKNIINNIRNNYKWAIIVLIAGIFLGWLFFHPSGENGNSTNQEQTGHEGHDHDAEAATLWTCSMHPQIKQDKPGKCPICAMELIPVSDMQSDQENVDPDEIQMTESAAKLADVQTLIVEKGVPSKELFLQGKVQADERRISELTARFGGRIEKLFVSFTGENVRKGQKLATIYSPELVVAQRELLEAAGLKEVRPTLYNAARGKLRLWDITQEQINAIEEKGEPQLYFDILSPISGTVTRRHVTLGDYVKEGSALFEVIDLTHVWIMFDAYESDLPWINTGDGVSYSVQSLPGKSFQGKVVYIDPFIDPATRVAKVRAEQNNPGLTLKPEMFVNGTVESDFAGKAHEILIPKSSILWTGKRAVVYVKVPDRDHPSFLYREIVLGPESGKFYVVSEGLAEGEEIVVNGVFKIDAAAQLAGKTSMMNPEGGKVSLAHDHGSMGTVDAGDQSENQPMEMDNNFREQLQRAYNSYILMKDAFVASNAKDAGKQARKVKSDLKEVDMGLLEGDAHMLWMKHLEKLNAKIDLIASSTDIAEQRVSFAEFNNTFYTSIKSFGLHHGTVYYQYCPMANGDEGAYWLSTFKEIKNPYFGEAMLSCGETRETLKF